MFLTSVGGEAAAEASISRLVGHKAHTSAGPPLGTPAPVEGLNFSPEYRDPYNLKGTAVREAIGFFLHNMIIKTGKGVDKGKQTSSA